MIRHVRGEALAVGDVLTWGPGYYYQKQFFSGHVYEPHNGLEHAEYQEANNVTETPGTPHDVESLVRYDVEVYRVPIEYLWSPYAFAPAGPEFSRGHPVSRIGRRGTFRS